MVAIHLHAFQHLTLPLFQHTSDIFEKLRNGSLFSPAGPADDALWQMDYPVVSQLSVQYLELLIAFSRLVTHLILTSYICRIFSQKSRPLDFITTFLDMHSGGAQPFLLMCKRRHSDMKRLIIIEMSDFFPDLHLSRKFML